VGQPLDLERLAQAFGPKTRAIILNTPNNPTGKVFTAEELAGIAGLCQCHGVYAITDEIYEHIVYEGKHIPIATLPGMAERTVTISGASKTYAITGWRIGTIIAPPALTAAIRKVHDFLTVGAPAPLQEAVATAMDELPREYYAGMAQAYRQRRDLLCGALLGAGFQLIPPEGAYYVLADYSALGREDDVAFATRLVKEAGVATVPLSSFTSDPTSSRRVRFAFCKTTDLLETAAQRLLTFAGRR
jgi:aminotransferase